MGEMDEIVGEFLVESYENLDQLDRDLVALEKNPNDRGTIASVFRTIHTIKGTCGFLGFSKLESVAHVGENLLSRLRDGVLSLTPEITTALLAMVDAVRQILSCIEANGLEGDKDYSQLVESLTRLQTTANEQSKAAVPFDPPKAEQAEKTDATPTAELARMEAPVVASNVVESRIDAPAQLCAESAHNPLPANSEHAEPGKHQDAPEALRVQQDGKGTAIADTSIRVDVGLLDKLMNLVGELVLARNQILQFTATQQDPLFVGTSQRLNLITTELQEGVMKTRMQPIGIIWSKFPRVVRDLATMCGKEIRIEVEGKETELDKTIAEAIKDPLTHIVRNSADHGIETPAERVAKGKSAEGCLLLRAFHEGGQVNIEISDDGAGIDPEKIKQKAVQRGLIGSDQAARMSDREALNLIFLPGLSMAEKVTNVSGRGVGMDVVKTNIEKIGGTVDIQSKRDQGTTLKIKIPLTLAIIPALIVTNGGDRYAIPQVSLLELVRLEGEQASRGIELIHGVPVYRLRGNLLPLVHLDRILRQEQGSKGASDDTVNIVVLQADDRQFGLVVEGINDTEEIVVKPLGKQFKGLSVFAGATIMGDGKVALILDVLGIAQKANVVSEIRDRALADKNGEVQKSGDQKQTLLLCGVNKTGRMAIPLSTVARLEEFSRSSIERAANREVVQYRGHIMPLIRLSNVLTSYGVVVGEDPETLQVVVYSDRGRSVGLVVEQILDIAEESVNLQRREAGTGILGSAIIQQKVTDLLDLEGIIRYNDSAFSSREPAEAARV